MRESFTSVVATCLLNISECYIALFLLMSKQWGRKICI
jgi:hypothetical protein